MNLLDGEAASLLDVFMPEDLAVASSRRDCPCPGVFKEVAYCDDCPYRDSEENDEQSD